MVLGSRYLGQLGFSFSSAGVLGFQRLTSPWLL